jgi:hypothetical protein
MRTMGVVGQYIVARDGNIVHVDFGHGWHATDDIGASRLRRLRAQALQSASASGEDPPVSCDVASWPLADIRYDAIDFRSRAKS